MSSPPPDRQAQATAMAEQLKRDLHDACCSAGPKCGYGCTHAKLAEVAILAAFQALQQGSEPSYSTGWCKHGYPVCGNCGQQFQAAEQARAIAVVAAQDALREVMGELRHVGEILRAQSEQSVIDAAQETILALDIAEAFRGPHRCSGCGHQWEAPVTVSELCGDCWRKGQHVFHSRHTTALQDAEARARRPLEDAIKEQCSDCADGIAFDFDMGMHRKWPGVWQACTVPKWVHAALRARSRETP